jgi:hypothetical protein
LYLRDCCNSTSPPLRRTAVKSRPWRWRIFRGPAVSFLEGERDGIVLRRAKASDPNGSSLPVAYVKAQHESPRARGYHLKSQRRSGKGVGAPFPLVIRGAPLVCPGRPRFRSCLTGCRRTISRPAV